MNQLPDSIDRDVLAKLINLVRAQYSDLQIYEGLFYGHTVVVLGSDDDLSSIEAVCLPTEYMQLGLGLLGDAPFMVGYTYHDWYDVPPDRRGQSVTLSNKRLEQEDNNTCITVRWTNLNSGKAEVVIESQAFPETWSGINEARSVPALTSVGSARYHYRVDPIGKLTFVESSYHRLEEYPSDTGVDRIFITTKLGNIAEPRMGTDMRINLIKGIFGDIHNRDEYELVVESDDVAVRNGKQHDLFAPFLNGTNEQRILAVSSMITEMMNRWDQQDNWILQL